jgi:hypothetical protein
MNQIDFDLIFMVEYIKTLYLFNSRFDIHLKAEFQKNDH